MSAPVGSIPNVTGKSIAMVAMGPTPGKTPIKVPTKQPKKQSPIFLRLSAVEKPSARLSTNCSIGMVHMKAMTGMGKRKATLNSKMQKPVKMIEKMSVCFQLV